jgi:hypothetical protein
MSGRGYGNETEHRLWGSLIHTNRVFTTTMYGSDSFFHLIHRPFIDINNLVFLFLAHRIYRTLVCIVTGDMGLETNIFERLTKSRRFVIGFTVVRRHHLKKINYK